LSDDGSTSAHVGLSLRLSKRSPERGVGIASALFGTQLHSKGFCDRSTIRKPVLARVHLVWQRRKQYCPAAGNSWFSKRSSFTGRC